MGLAELSPSSFTQDRRRTLLARLGNAAFLIPAAREQVRNGDAHHPYRQDSNFFYLTEFQEPEALLLLRGGPEPREILFCRPRHPERERWDGPRLGAERAPEALAVQEAKDLAEFGEVLVEVLKGCEALYYQLGDDGPRDQQVLSTLRRLRSQARRGQCWPSAIIEPGVLLEAMRLRKDELEIARISHAAAISAAAHCEAMVASRAGMREFELQAVVEAGFRRRGATGVAYPSIVGGGANGTVLHYVANDALLGAEDLVLIDAGCEFECYASDITRTFPVSGRYTPAQREIYDLVLAAQLEVLALAGPGCTWGSLQELAVKRLTQGLVELGILPGPLPAALEEKAYLPYYMHRVGHLLGLDVHDAAGVPPLRDEDLLVPGMVLTVEPGLYFPPESDAPERYRGIGIRIEDTILVTEEGHLVLTAGVPKHPAEVEALMATP